MYPIVNRVESKLILERESESRQIAHNHQRSYAAKSESIHRPGRLGLLLERRCRRREVRAEREHDDHSSRAEASRRNWREYDVHWLDIRDCNGRTRLTQRKKGGRVVIVTLRVLLPVGLQELMSGGKCNQKDLA